MRSGTGRATSHNRLRYVLAVVALGVVVLANAFAFYALGGGLTHSVTLRGPFSADAESRLVQAQLPTDQPFGCCARVLSDSPGNNDASRLRLWIGGQEALPAHTLHETIRKGGPGFSHWNGAVLFSLPQGMPNTDETEIELNYPLIGGRMLLVVPIATVLLAGMVAAIMLVRLGPSQRQKFLLTARNAARMLFSVPKRVSMNGASGRSLRFRLNVVLAVLALCTIGLAVLGVVPWQKSETFVGPFASASGSAHQITPTKPKCCLAVQSDGPQASTRSNLRLWINETEITPAHSVHETLRTGNPGLSHWGDVVLFTLPPGVRNDSTVRATISYSLRAEIPLPLLLGLIISTLALASALHGRRVLQWLAPDQLNGVLRKALADQLSAAPARLYRWLVPACLFVVFIVLAWPLREPDLEFAFEADFDSGMISMWRHFLLTWDVDRLQRPFPFHSYLDGQYIFYGAVANVLEGVARLVPAARATFPNETSFALGAAVLGHIVVYAAACVIFYLSFVRLTREIAVSAALAVGLFLAPQIIEISLVRVDYLVLLALSVIFYCSIAIAQREERLIHAVALGASMAFAATLKINGLFFAILPALATISALIHSRSWDIRANLRFTIIAVLVFAPLFLIFMFRFFNWLSLQEIFLYFKDGMADVERWKLMTNASPAFYYNIELMRGHGVLFIALYLTSGFFVMVYAACTRSGPAVFLALSFIVLSLASETTLKHPRAGYHMLPIFFACIGYMLSVIRRYEVKGRVKLSWYIKVTIFLAAGSVFASSLVSSARVYHRRAAEMALRPVAVQSLKRAPRAWLVANAPASARICILHHSDWTAPPVSDLGVTHTYGPFLIPFLDPEKLKTFEPPGENAIKGQCDFVLVTDYHREIYARRFEQVDPALGERWRAFFQKLTKDFPTVSFNDPVGIYGLKQVDIFDVR